MKSGFDVDSLERDFGHIFEDYLELNKKALPVLLKKRAVQLAIGSGKGASFKGLFQEAMDLRPLVKSEIQSLPKRLNHHILRHERKTELDEIKARLANAGRFQASGWLVPELLGDQMPGGPGGMIKTQRGYVDMNLDGDNPSIRLVNSSPRALEYALATGYMARAVYNQTQDMMEYIQKHLDLTSAEMSKRYPNFRQPIENFIPE